MRKIFIFVLLLSSGLYSQNFKLRVDLSGKWLFKTGDDERWALPEFDDSGWEKIKVPASWESQGYDGYDGYAWYRVHFDIKKGLLKSELLLILGKIDDVDEVYLNGIKIGSTGGFPPEKKTEWNTLRIYEIPSGLLRARGNVLAVRVCDFGLDGGIFDGQVGIMLKSDFSRRIKSLSKPHRSVDLLVTSNGLTAGVYSVKEHKIIALYEHIYRMTSSGEETKNYLFEGYFIVELNGRRYDLSKISEDEVGYIDGTNIIYARYRKLGITTYYFAPFHVNDHVFVAICKINKKYRSSRIYFVENSVNGISIDGETASDGVISIGKILKLHRVSRTLKVLRKDGGGGDVEKRVFFRIGGLKSVEENREFSRLTNRRNVLQEEMKFWRKFHKKIRFSVKLRSKYEKKLLRQSLAILKMAQCREEGSSFGQVLASLPPGRWNWSWVRDAAYAINAMIETGMYDEARWALEFMLKAKSGHYKKYTHTDGRDYGVGFDYKITVCKYYGDGVEESDSNEDGPNIELDGFGLFLWAFGNYVEKSKDYDFAIIYWDTVLTKIADVIIASIDEMGVIRADSGPWERHLPGRHYAYTTICNIQGLRSIAKVAEILKERTLARYYRTIADSVLLAFLRNFVDGNGVIKGTLEAVDEDDFEYYDASVVEAINFGLIDPGSKVAINTLKAIKRNLKLRHGGRGFFRVNNGDWYDRQEWVFINLRVASALHRSGFHKDARRILNWVTQQSRWNFYLIAELYDEITADYQGQYPMVGFGAGAYILALIDIY